MVPLRTLLTSIYLWVYLWIYLWVYLWILMGVNLWVDLGFILDYNGGKSLDVYLGGVFGNIIE